MSTAQPSGSPVVRFLTGYWLPLLIAIVAVVFIAQNRDSTSTTLFWFSFNAPLWLTLAVITALSFGGGFLFGRRRRS